MEADVLTSEKTGDERGQLEKAVLKKEIAWLRDENRRLREVLEAEKEANRNLQYAIEVNHLEISNLQGMVKAFEFAIRCNGVSGAEVVK